MTHQIRLRRARTGPPHTAPKPAPSPQTPSSHSRYRPRTRLDRTEAQETSEVLDGLVAPALVIEVRQDLARPLVTVSGELDLTSVGLLTAMVEHVARGPHDRREVVDLDLSGVTFADSHGLAPVLDGRARIVAASAQVRRVRRLLQDLPDVA